MPTLDENAKTWDGSYDWSKAGDEWSAPWGGTEAEWWGTLYPRIHAFLPVGTILEIAPGYGRWTQYLKDLCDHLIGVDLAEKCIEACRRRFSDSPNTTFQRNDGLTFPGLSDASVDFAFSFDSLVHAEADALHSYVRELSRVLKPDGVAWLHHSNMGDLRLQRAISQAVPMSVRAPLVQRGLLIDPVAWRATSTSAKLFEAQCTSVGLKCIGQEKLAWRDSSYLTDVISLVARPGSSWARENRVVENRDWMKEANIQSRSSTLYAAGSFSRRVQ